MIKYEICFPEFLFMYQKKLRNFSHLPEVSFQTLTQWMQPLSSSSFIYLVLFSFHLASSSPVRTASLMKLSFKISKPNPNSPEKCFNTPSKGHTHLKPRYCKSQYQGSAGSKCRAAKCNDWIFLKTISATFALMGELYGQVLARHLLVKHTSF